jgi:transketolase
VGRAGKTHQIVDDMSIMRAMPGFVVLAPADEVETAQVLRWAHSYDGPVYVRLVRDATQRLFDGSYAFEFGKAVVVRQGSDLTLISTGAQTPRVVDAADLLAAQGIDAHIIHVPTIKPFDVTGIVAAAERTGFVVTVEEHSIIGGLGGAVAETLSEHRPTVVKRIGLHDVFGQSGGNDDLLNFYGLSAPRVAEQVAAYLNQTAR